MRLSYNSRYPSIEYLRSLARRRISRFADEYRDQITNMMDSGIRSGPDIARTLASGSEFTVLGRAFMYGTAALGSRGGDHTISILKTQLQQVMEQICCELVRDFAKHLAPSIRE